MSTARSATDCVSLVTTLITTSAVTIPSSLGTTTIEPSKRSTVINGEEPQFQLLITLLVAWKGSSAKKSRKSRYDGRIR